MEKPHINQSTLLQILSTNKCNICEQKEKRKNQVIVKVTQNNYKANLAE